MKILSKGKTVFLAGGFLLAFCDVFGQSVRSGQVPAEYDFISGPSLALNSGGTCGVDSAGAIRINPGLLERQKNYTVAGAYFWPEEGREAYQVSVVDGKSSSLSAGLSMTSFGEPYEGGRDRVLDSYLDSPLVRRASVALSQNMQGIGVGIGATYIESEPLPDDSKNYLARKRAKGFGINLGLAGQMGKNGLLWGVSAENLSNRKLDRYQPRTLRAGIGFLMGSVIALADLRQRNYVDSFEKFGTLDLDNPQTKKSGEDRMAIGSLLWNVTQNVRLSGSYARKLEDGVQALGAGVVVAAGKASLSYSLQNPDLAQKKLRQAVHVAVDVAM